MRKQNTTGDGKSAEVSMCREGQQDVGRISGKQQDAACASEEQVIRTTGRNNCGGRCVICVHMKDGTIDHLST